MIDLSGLEVWFITGSQHLYGEAPLAEVQAHSETIARELAGATPFPVPIVAKPIMTTPDSIRQLCLAASTATNCIGLIAWMHTFSPAKMWIGGLKHLSKPLLHLHTQFNREIPYATIDMDFMNLNQSAHGDREFGFLTSRMRMNRKVVVGFWRDDDVHDEISTWIRAAAAWHDAQHLKIARFGDNMRGVAVTEGDKVEAELRWGYSVNSYGIGDLVASVDHVSEQETDTLVAEYDTEYQVAESLRPDGNQRTALRDAARIEIGLRHFLQQGGFYAFTDTFEVLHGLSQLPGVAVQRLMSEGYGFGAEGDWKTAALVRSMKVMSAGLPGGTSFMEDYTYDFRKPARVLGAHMLEVCPSIAAGKPSLQISPLSIGEKADPVRLVFTARTGSAINASVVDMGDRFRMIVNRVECIAPDEPLPKLPVGRAVWIPQPDLKTAAAAWMFAGGAHHTSLSFSLTPRHLADFADMANVEFLLIDENTQLAEFRKELRWNDVYYRLAQGIGSARF